MDNGIGVIRPVWEAFLLRLWQNVHEVFMNGVHLEDENLVTGVRTFQKSDSGGYFQVKPRLLRGFYGIQVG